MTAATVADIYEQYIRQLSAAEQLALLALIAQRLAHPVVSPEEPPARSIKELHGVGRASWDGSDAQEFVNTLRAEWDERRW
jgi:hypothetical protein